MKNLLISLWRRNMLKKSEWVIIKSWIWGFFPNCTRWGTWKIPVRKLIEIMNIVDFKGESTGYMHFLRTKDGRRYIEFRPPRLFLDPEVKMEEYTKIPQVFIGNKETISENMVVALVMAVQEENKQIETRENRC